MGLLGSALCSSGFRFVVLVQGGHLCAQARCAAHQHALWYCLPTGCCCGRPALQADGMLGRQRGRMSCTVHYALCCTRVNCLSSRALDTCWRLDTSTPITRKQCCITSTMHHACGLGATGRRPPDTCPYYASALCLPTAVGVQLPCTACTLKLAVVGALLAYDGTAWSFGAVLTFCGQVQYILVPFALWYFDKCFFGR
jgi:hypothetical protein